MRIEGNWELGDLGTWGFGDLETWGIGETFSIAILFTLYSSLSPYLPISLSLHLLIFIPHPLFSL